MRTEIDNGGTVSLWMNDKPMPCPEEFELHADIPAGSRRVRRRIFTLIELLVVIGIIAILASMLLPALKSATDQAKMIVCVSNLRQNGLACNMYAGDNNNFLPPFKKYGANTNDRNNSLIFSTPQGVDTWYYMGMLVKCKYLPKVDTLYCPTATGQYARSYNILRSSGYKQRPIRDLPAADSVIMNAVDGGAIEMYIRSYDMAERVILSDLLDYQLSGDPNPGVQNTRHATQGINVLYGDGVITTDRTGHWVVYPQYGTDRDDEKPWWNMNSGNVYGWDRKSFY